MKWHTFCLLCLTASLCSGLTAAEQASRFAVTNSRSDYSHWIDLYDANNRRIDPSDPNAGPYSPVTTCGRCHDYESIASGHHFNAIHSSLPAGRPGEPWIWTDDRTGTQLPLSYRRWEGTHHPDDVGISPWDFVLKFGRHLPGGGPGQPPRQEPAARGRGGGVTGIGRAATDSGGADRWRLSGFLQIDCLFCHTNDKGYSPEEWWSQIRDQNFAWAPTAAAGLGAVDGKVSGLADDFDPANAAPGGRNRLPATTYGSLRMNADKKVFIDVVRRPDDRTCYYCHTTQMVGSDAVPIWNQDEDVHLRAGMTCTDCHRNDIGHHTVRGYEGEVHPTGLSVLRCRAAAATWTTRTAREAGWGRRSRCIRVCRRCISTSCLARPVTRGRARRSGSTGTHGDGTRLGAAFPRLHDGLGARHRGAGDASGSGNAVPAPDDLAGVLGQVKDGRSHR
jgi:hypothetical protein